jgi:hypothetical membrane protein
MMAHHEIGLTIFFWGAITSVVIPILLAWKWGERIALGATAVWFLAWVALMMVPQPHLAIFEAVGAALIPTVWWLLGVAIGLGVHNLRGSRAARTPR